MKFYSTQHKTPMATLDEVIFRGTAPDKGLYMPESIPKLPSRFLASLDRCTFHEIAMTVSRIFFGDVISDADLKAVVEEALDFDIPLVSLHDDIFVLELFHGPTLAFKDVGARFMARMCHQIRKDRDDKLVILVATSGDTGSAVAHGFLGVKGVKVVVLYPRGRVSRVQERQFTTLGENVTALAIEGSFDDCQRLVKRAFDDQDVRKEISLASANSINFVRLLPQSFYYFYAVAQIRQKHPRYRDLIVSVPCGNLGNLTAGLIARKMGLPIERFIAATNINDVLPHYLRTHTFSPRPSLTTLANAMDVGNPSNFARILDLFCNDHRTIQKTIASFVCTDEDITTGIRAVFRDHRYTLDPHSVIAYEALKEYLHRHREAVGVCLATAHPAKFRDTVERAIEHTIPLPERLAFALELPSRSVTIPNDYRLLKKHVCRVGKGECDHELR